MGHLFTIMTPDGVKSVGSVLPRVEGFLDSSIKSFFRHVFCLYLGQLVTQIRHLLNVWSVFSCLRRFFTITIYLPNFYLLIILLGMLNSIQTV